MLPRAAARPFSRALLALPFALAAATLGRAASLEEIDDFGPNPGELGMHVYATDGLEPGSALVVALHGCDQQAADFDDETGLTALADAHGFLLLFPEQRAANNPQRCFNWFGEQDSEPGEGESGSIRSMVDHAVRTGGIDPSRVFVLGLSAGGSMTAVLLANYPELFAGGAIVAGTPYDCNRPSFWTWGWWWWLKTGLGDAAAAAHACGLFGAAPSEREAEEWGDFVRAAPDSAPESWPRVSLWQGAADRIVSPGNQAELVKQWTDVHGIDQTPDGSEELGAITHSLYRDAAGAALVESYEIAEFEHALPVDPGTGPEQCGSEAPYIEDADICGALRILQFWGIVP